MNALRPLAAAIVVMGALLSSCGTGNDTAAADTGRDAPIPKTDTGTVGVDTYWAGPCVGPTPPKEAWDASPWPLTDPDATIPEVGSPGAPTTPGTEAPLYALTDFQPKSCGFRATYGLPPFKGKVTVAALLAGS